MDSMAPWCFNVSSYGSTTVSRSFQSLSDETKPKTLHWATPVYIHVAEFDRLVYKLFILTR